MELTRPLILLDTNIVLYFLGGKLVNPLQSANYSVSVTRHKLLQAALLPKFEASGLSLSPNQP